jgi:hypothetical protein
MHAGEHRYPRAGVNRLDNVRGEIEREIRVALGDRRRQ